MKHFFTKTISGLMIAAMLLTGMQPSAFAARALTMNPGTSTDPYDTHNVLQNPGFESAIGGTNWNDTQGATRVTSIPAALGGGSFAEGSAGVSMAPGADANPGSDFDFTFQNFDNVKPGDLVSFSGLVNINFADDGGAPFDLGAEIKIEYRIVNSDGSTTLIREDKSRDTTGFVVDTGGAFQEIQVSGIVPEGTDRVVFTMVTVDDDDPAPADPALAQVAIFDRMLASINPTAFNVQLARRKAKAGDIVPALISFKNESGSTFNNVQLKVDNPKGINVQLSDVQLNYNNAHATAGSVIVPIGTLTAGESTVITLPFVITSAVQPGHLYDIDFILSDSAGMNFRARERLLIEDDPMFDQSTVIGKVFYDRNRDGVQQDGEPGMPFVNLYTEEGIRITTDENGMYHIPNIRPGRHVLKIDAHTLPENTEFITEESYLFKSTPGVMNKVNFAVAPRGKEDWEGGNPLMPQEFEGELSVQITQGLDTTPPQLDVTMEPDVLRLGAGVLEQKPIFTFDINYPHLVRKWMLEIRDEMGRKVWSGYGIGRPPADVLWEGLADSGILVPPGIYSYQFKVEDDKGHQDWSMLKFFRVFSKVGKVATAEDWEGSVKEQTVYQSNPKANKNYVEEIPPVGNFNIFQDGKRSIPLVAKPTVHVRGRTIPGYKAYVNSAPVFVSPETGYFDKEFYVNPGDNEFIINVVSPEGESTLYTEKVKVKDSMFFLVALGEQELGTNFSNGSIETVGSDEQYKDGFYQDGRAAFFLKGKLKGKFLVKAKYDTGDQRTGLFTNLDPDDYYPIYGDNSQISYEGQNTASRFYMLVEMDRSFVRWGSFQTEFDDTELASYNRTLSGLQVQYESLESTPYGDPKRGFKLFSSQSRNRAAHVELESTGGTLYYLRDQEIVEGSEQLSIEIRDKIQDIAIGRYDLQEGVDYEIDYDAGRVMLSRPLSSMAAAHTLFSTDLADGNRVFLIADYEYVADFDPRETDNRGIRGFVHMGDHVRVGGTAVEERRDGADYDLRAVDMTMKFGRNTRIIAEYATSMLQQQDQAVSYDGGFNYANLGLLSGRKNDGRERAYLIKAESKPIKQWEVNGFLQGVEPGFSNDILKSQEGYKKYGVATRFRFTDDLQIKYRYDHNEIEEGLLPLTSGTILAPFESFNSHTAGITYDDGIWLAEAEYFRRTLNGPDNPDFLSPSLESEIPFNDGIVAKLGYRVNERFMPYVKGQVAIHTKGNHQFGGGMRYEVMNDLYAYVEQMFGKIGDSTLFGIEKRHGTTSSTYATLKSYDRGIGSKTLSTAIGSNYFMDNGSRLYSERQHSTYNSVDGFADIFGYESKIGDHWDYGARYERRHLQNSTTRRLDTLALEGLARSNTYNTVGGHIAYIGSAQKTEDWEGNVKYSPFEKLKFRVSGEFRRDQDQPELWQVVTRNSLEYKVSRDLSFLSYLNLSYSSAQFSSNAYDFDTNFMEWNTGFAYRPVNYDRLNVLMRYTRIINSDKLSLLGTDLNTEDNAHIIQMDLSFDINKYLELVEKIGFKRSVAALASDDFSLNTFLWANRLNFHVTRKWDIAAEYRILIQDKSADTRLHGALIEVDRELYDYVRVGLGYDFADFTDDLRKSNDYSSHGPYVRMTGKF